MTRSLFLLAILGLAFFAPRVAAQNGYLTNMNMPRYLKAGENYTLSMRARNSASTAYFYFQVSWKLDDGAVHTMNQSIGGGGIVGASYWPVDHPDQMSATVGPHVLKVWIFVPGDTDASNDTLTFNFTALNNWADKVVLMEARTETWCPNCPPANIVTDQLLYDPQVAVVKFHITDGLEFPDAVEYYTDNYIGSMNDFTPAGVIEMGDLGDYFINANHINWVSETDWRANGVSPVQLTMNSVLNNSTRQLTVTLNAEFTYAVPGPFKMNVYLAENNVQGEQENAPPNYIHNGLLRAMLGGASGTAGEIPNAPVVGNTYSHTYNYTVPAEFKLQDLYLVGVLEQDQGSDRYCLNAISSLHTVVGISDGEVPTFSLWPNPASDLLNITAPDHDANTMISVLSVDGRIVLQQRVVFNGSGQVTLDVSTLSEGVYTLMLGEDQAGQKFVKY
jgi:hypothetical protein